MTHPPIVSNLWSFLGKGSFEIGGKSGLGQGQSGGQPGELGDGPHTWAGIPGEFCCGLGVVGSTPYVHGKVHPTKPQNMAGWNTGVWAINHDRNYPWPMSGFKGWELQAARKSEGPWNRVINSKKALRPDGSGKFLFSLKAVKASLGHVPGPSHLGATGPWVRLYTEDAGLPNPSAPGPAQFTGIVAFFDPVPIASSRGQGPAHGLVGGGIFGPGALPGPGNPYDNWSIIVDKGP